MGRQGGLHKKRSEGISLVHVNGARSQSRGRVGRRTCGRGPHHASVCGRSSWPVCGEVEAVEYTVFRVIIQLSENVS